MLKRYSITQAKSNLSHLVGEVEKGDRVELTRRGKTVAVLIGVESPEALSQGEVRGFREAYQEFLRTHDLVTLNIDPDEIWGDVRDPSPGRDFEW
jgi:prevent-host-death family protein